jgi:hypothetical protein
MLSVADAERLVSQHLGDTPRAAHSRFVAYLMRQLASECAADADLWEVVGTRDDPARHGLLAAQWLGDGISPDARRAIEAHDHRTGVTAETPVADMLKLADVLAVTDARLGRATLATLDDGAPLAALRTALAGQPYLCDMLERYAAKHGLALKRIAAILTAAPPQD